MVACSSKGSLWHVLQGARVEKVMMQPYPLTPHFFSERMKGLDLDVSAAIFEELKAVEVIREDDHSHFGWYETW